MRTIADIRHDLNAKITEVKGIDAKNVEAMNQASEELKALVAELNLANETEAAAQRAAENKLEQLQKESKRAFSIVKFLREASEGNLTGLEAEVAKMGSDEYKRLGFTRMANSYVIPAAVLRSATGQNVGSNSEGGYLKVEQGPRYIDDLKQRLVVAKLGATVLTDLIGTVPLITSAQISAAWKAEAAQGSASKAEFARAALVPHRNFVKTAVTRDLLVQTSLDVEGLLWNKMMDAHANLIEAAAIAGSGSNNEPTGILSTANIPTVTMGDAGAAISWAKVVELETRVNSNNGNRGRLGYLTNSKVWGSMKTTEKAQTSGRFIVEEGAGFACNGYPCEWTNLVPSNLTKGSGSSAVSNLSAMIFGNFEDLYIGSWGGLEIIVDPLTRADYGEIVMTLNAYDDAVVAQKNSFAVIKDIIA